MSDNSLIAVPEDLKFVARLPAELKGIILEHYLQFPRLITSKTHSSLFRLRVLTFALNNSFAGLAKRLYYSSNVFRLTLEDFFRGQCPSPQASELIQHLEISMRMMEPDDYLALECQKLGASDLEILKWIPKFPNLKTLALVLHSRAPSGSVHCEDAIAFLSRYHGCRHPDDAFPRYSVLLSAILVAVRPYKFAIILSGKECPWLREEHAGKECGCRMSFEKSLLTYIMG